MLNVEIIVKLNENYSSIKNEMKFEDDVEILNKIDISINHF